MVTPCYIPPKAAFGCREAIVETDHLLPPDGEHPVKRAAAAVGIDDEVNIGKGGGAPIQKLGLPSPVRPTKGSNRQDDGVDPELGLRKEMRGPPSQ